MRELANYKNISSRVKVCEPLGAVAVSLKITKNHLFYIFVANNAK